MLEGLRGYVALASGLTEATAAKAREVATALVAQGGVTAVPATTTAMAVQIAGLAEDLLVTARDNRGVLLEVVRAEAERAVAALGVVTTVEADALRRRIAELERTLADERRGRASSRASAQVTGAPEASFPVRRKTAPRKQALAGADATGRQGGVETAVGKSTSSEGNTATKKTIAKKVATKKTAPKRTTAKKSTAKRTTAKKSTAKKSTAKKSTAKSASTSSTGKQAVGRKATSKGVAARTSTPREATPPSASPPGTTDD